MRKRRGIMQYTVDTTVDVDVYVDDMIDFLEEEGYTVLEEEEARRVLGPSGDDDFKLLIREMFETYRSTKQVTDQQLVVLFDKMLGRIV